MKSPEFSESGRPLCSETIDTSVRKRKVDVAASWAVLAVETRGFGFLPDRRPAISLERLVFHKRTQGKFSATHPDISNPKAGAYGTNCAFHYLRLANAAALDRRVALRSL
jgi:hypothetical protein